MVATALTIAGSDPSGGAGIQADLKTFSALEVYGMSVITALTAQNTTGVSAIHLVPPDFVQQQVQSILSDIRINAIKVGMIANAEIGAAIANSLDSIQDGIDIILDPVMVAKGGASLLAPSAVNLLCKQLVPMASLITPNLEEAAVMLNTDIATDRETMLTQGQRLLDLGAKAVFLKGGHLSSSESPDLLVTQKGIEWYEGMRINTKNTHGTGCTVSAAITAEISKGNGLNKAISIGKEFIQGAIQNADILNIGSGHGPTNHIHTIWKE